MFVLNSILLTFDSSDADLDPFQLTLSLAIWSWPWLLFICFNDLDLCSSEFVLDLYLNLTSAFIHLNLTLTFIWPWPFRCCPDQELEAITIWYDYRQSGGHSRRYFGRYHAGGHTTNKIMQVIINFLKTYVR
jgi:hypothetical protein